MATRANDRVSCEAQQIYLLEYLTKVAVLRLVLLGDKWLWLLLVVQMNFLGGKKQL